MLTIYKASAGSGKTYNLALEYIRMLLAVKLDDGRYVLDNPRYTGRRQRRRAHSRILAITFTNKATAEMKSRIIKELDLLGRIPAPGERDAAYASTLIAELDCTRQELAQAAADALRALLTDYSAFNVSTIDSFFQSVLRNFAREIDRQGDFRLELDRDYALVAALSLLFDEVNDGDDTPEAVRRWIESVAYTRLGNGKDFNPFNRRGSVFRELTSLLSNTFDSTFEQHADSIHDFLRRPDAIDGFTRHLERLTLKCDTDIADAARALEATLLAEGYSLDTLARTLRPWIDRSLSGDIPDTDAPKVYNTASKSYSKSFAAIRAQDSSLVRGGFYVKGADPSIAVDDALYRWFDTLERSLVRRSIFSRLEKSVDTLTALSYISDYINRFRQQNNLILLDDTNSLLGAIISESEAPFIYERVGVELHHFLIDEFQDTSRMQWNNLRPLIANSMAVDDDSLIIGDVKQSIYRWRGGEASLLDTEVEQLDFPANNILRGAAPGENTNHRSAHGIVRFNNTVFHLLAADAGVSGYSSVAQQLADSTARLDAFISVTAAGAPDPDDPAADPRMEAIIATGAAIIAQHRRGYAWKDIAVLCRRNDEAALVIDTFSRLYPEIRVISEDALLVNRSPAVRLIVSMLEILDMDYVDRPGLDEHKPDTATTVSPDGVCRPAVADPCRMLMDRFEYFMAHGESTGDALTKALDMSINIADRGMRVGSLDDDIAAIRALSPANLVALVEAVIERKLPPEQRAAELPYINAFVDAVNDFSSNYIPTVHAFLAYWQSVRDSLTIGSPEGADAVPVLTVHKAKGLEWDCVHIPLMDWELQARASDGWFSLDAITDIPADERPALLYISGVARSPLWELPASPFASQIALQRAKDSADNLNVAYVAFTRAVRELHICCHPLPDDRQQRALMPRLADALALTDFPGADLPQFMRPGDYVDDNGNFVFGAPTAPVAPHDDGPQQWKRPAVKPAPAPPPPYEVQFTDTNRRVTRVESLFDRIPGPLDVDLGNDAPAASVTDSTPDDTDRRLAIAARRGNDLHAILALMYTRDDLDKALDTVTARLDSEVRDLYRMTLSEAFDAAGPLARRWFSPDASRILCEQTVYCRERDANFRPDRIVWYPDGSVDIIDYKFTSATDDAHRRQMLGYIGMLRSMGYSCVNGYIWYLSLNKTFNVTL